jgi:hypothetical protein
MPNIKVTNDPTFSNMPNIKVVVLVFMVLSRQYANMPQA